jgi:hypothetical protein
LPSGCRSGLCSSDSRRKGCRCLIFGKTFGLGYILGGNSSDLKSLKSRLFGS